MKILHLGDLHLGKRVNEISMIEDQKFILDQIVTLVKEEKIDVILLCGDIYDKAIPTIEAIHLLDEFLEELSDLKVKVLMISGNHDSDERLNYGSDLFEKNQIYISAKYEGNLYKKTVTDDYGEIDIYLLPFVKASQVKHFLPDAGIENYDDAVREVLEQAEIDRTRRNVIVAHQFVTGKSEEPVTGGSEGVGVQSVGLVEKIGYDCFDAFDYVALGHIHSPQKIGREEVRYSGSPLKYSLSEVANDKSVPVITIKEKDKTSVELIPLKPMRDMRHIKGKLEQLLKTENVTGTEDFIYATLTDEDMVNDVMGIFQQIYPNTVKIDYDNSHTKQIEQVDISKIAENRSFGELIGDFYNKIYGCEISEEEMDIMRMVAREAGVMDEAD